MKIKRSEYEKAVHEILRLTEKVQKDEVKLAGLKAKLNGHQGTVRYWEEAAQEWGPPREGDEIIAFNWDRDNNVTAQTQRKAAVVCEDEAF